MVLRDQLLQRHVTPKSSTPQTLRMSTIETAKEPQRDADVHAAIGGHLEEEHADTHDNDAQREGFEPAAR
jgi:hypothetical protein